MPNSILENELGQWVNYSREQVTKILLNKQEILALKSLQWNINMHIRNVSVRGIKAPRGYLS